MGIICKHLCDEILDLGHHSSLFDVNGRHDILRIYASVVFLYFESCVMIGHFVTLSYFRLYRGVTDWYQEPRL